MALGAVIGALFGFALGGSGIAIFGFSAGSLWLLGASLGALFDAASFQVAVSTPNYSLDPVSNTLSGSLPVPIAYGRVRIAGNFPMEYFDTTDKKIMYVHCVLSEGPVVSIDFNDVKLNDYVCATLSTVSKSVFLGSNSQAASPYDPDGITYPYLAYISLKIEASAKIQGTPVITTVFNGRDIDYPTKGASGIDINAPYSSVSGGVTESSSNLGYKLQTSTAKGPGYIRYRKQVGETNNGHPIYDYYTKYLGTSAITSSAYTADDLLHVVCIPWTFKESPTIMNYADGTTFVFTVYPDATNSSDFYVFKTLSLSDVKASAVWMSDDESYGLYWELRRTYDDGAEYASKWYSGVLYFKIPADKVVYPGTAKIQIYTGPNSAEAPAGYSSYEQGIECGYINYTDILTDSPSSIFRTDAGFNNPAWCFYDFLTNERYGAGIDPNLIDVDTFSYVASKCVDEGITFNYLVDSYKSLLDHAGEMLTTFKGWMTVRDKIRIGIDCEAIAPVGSITMDDILEGSFAWWRTSSDQISNWITVEYIDGDGAGDGGTWERVSVYASDDADIDKRGVIEASYSFLGITNKILAQKMADYMLAKNTYGQIFCEFSTMLNTSGYDVGDVVYLTEDLAGWVNKPVRIISVTDGQAGTINYICNIYDSRVYDMF